jgi:two-component system cell cycle response regulator DivK
MLRNGTSPDRRLAGTPFSPALPAPDFVLERKTVLIVEDSRWYQTFLRAALERMGLVVLTADSAEQVPPLLAAHRPDLILTDIQLQGMNGLELTRQIKSDPRFQNISIIALTGDSFEDGERKASEAGCDGYLLKPIDLRTFPALIGKYLDRPAAGTPSDEPGRPPHDKQLALKLARLRKQFMLDGADECRSFLQLFEIALDLALLRKAAHRWAGCGGPAGLPEVTDDARAIEALLAGPALPREPIRKHLQQILVAFSNT